MQCLIDARDGGCYDVIVVGAGPAGVAAAVTAARCGARTLLLERNGRVGGMSTTGMLNQFVGKVENRLYLEILSRLAQKAPLGKREITKYIDAELLTVVYTELLQQARVEVRLYTDFCKALSEKDCVTGVLCHGKDGFVYFNAAVTVDATGDGDVAASAGASYVLGRETDGKMQPASVMFRVGGVDMDRAVFPDDFEDLIQTEKGELQALGRMHLPSPLGHVLLHRTTKHGIVACNMTNATGVDGTTSEGLTQAEFTCRMQIPAIVDFLQKFVPGYESCYALDSSSIVGIRETRHIKGIGVLTEKDITEAHQYEDAVVYGAHFNFDMHNLTGAGLDKTGCQRGFRQTSGYTIPYSSLVPEGVDGLLLAGRCISGTHMAHASYRVMPICIGTGEAAGAAAALCAREKKLPRELSGKEVRCVILDTEQI